jgi:hypothetical protein
MKIKLIFLIINVFNQQIVTFNNDKTFKTVPECKKEIIRANKSLSDYNKNVPIKLQKSFNYIKCVEEK